MLNDQSTPPKPDPLESCRVVVSAVWRSLIVWPGMKSPPDQTADDTATCTVWVSLKSTSPKLSVPVGTGLVASGVEEPLTPGCSATAADSGPLVTTGASL